MLCALDQAKVEWYTHRDKGAWLFTEVMGRDAQVTIRDWTFALADLYAQVEFADEPDK